MRPRLRTNEIQAFVTAGTLPQDAVAAMIEDEFDLPAGDSLEFGGEAAERDDAVGSLAASVGVLIGIAINDSIVVLAALRADPRARAGDVGASVDVVVRSTRHVLSTTITTIAGFTPLLLVKEGLWPPLAVSIAGGVVGATLLALTFVPGVFVMTTRRRAPELVAATA